jgi:hypothetical protein
MDFVAVSGGILTVGKVAEPAVDTSTILGRSLAPVLDLFLCQSRLFFQVLVLGS